MNEYCEQPELLAAAHTGEDYSQQLGSIAPPLYLSSLFACGTMENYTHSNPGSFIYSRYGNPNVSIVEEKVAALERGKYCLAYANGMAAASAAILALAKHGGHVVCLHNCYNVVSHFLDGFCAEKLGIETTYVQGNCFEQIEKAIRKNTFLIILESPASDTFSLVDIRRVCALAKAYGIKTYFDNTYCTPLYQKPLQLGVDICMHSATKYLGGHSDTLGGVLVTDDEEIYVALHELRPQLGNILSPMDAWLITRGLRSLAVRMPAHERTATAVAEMLEQHKKVRAVYYPGLKSYPQRELMLSQQTGNSGLLSFEIDGALEDAVKLADSLKAFTLGPSWGGYESLVIMPLYSYSEEHAMLCGASRGLIRLHCGLEGTQYLIDDLERVLGEL